MEQCTGSRGSREESASGNQEVSYLPWIEPVRFGRELEGLVFQWDHKVGSNSCKLMAHTSENLAESSLLTTKVEIMGIFNCFV